MDPEDPFAGMDPEKLRRGSLRALRALFPERFEPDLEGEPEDEDDSEDHLASEVEKDEAELDRAEEGMRHMAESAR